MIWLWRRPVSDHRARIETCELYVMDDTRIKSPGERSLAWKRSISLPLRH
jgi:hypothetical protein